MGDLGTRISTLCLAALLALGQLPLPAATPAEPNLPAEPPSATTPAPEPEPPPSRPEPGTGALQDVYPSDWFFPYVAIGALHGFIQGNDGVFAPNRAATRAEFVTMLARMHQALGGHLGAPLDHPPFVDVSPDHFSAPYLAWAFEIEAVHPNAEGQFRPGASISREEVAAMVAHYLEFYGLDDLFETAYEDHGLYADWEEIAPWALYGAHFLWNANLMHGTQAEDDSVYFHPRAEIYRREVFAIIGRVFQAIPIAEVEV
ncbi:MAG: S-layer homology domain-containing protein [Oscillospiraceae bacterium]|nr:S-layer homology domain-containing protein [Oscillospiraceae bacterium]